MKLIRDPKKFVSGSFSDVYFLNNDRVIKVFKSINHPNLEGVYEDRLDVENDFRVKVFESEFNAYEIANESEELVKHIPKFYGVKEISVVLDQQGKNISDWYLLNCNYEIELLEGNSTDFNSEDAEINRVIEKFIKNGVTYMQDSKVFTDYEHLIFIDFATEEAYKNAEYDYLINL